MGIALNVFEHAPAAITTIACSIILRHCFLRGTLLSFINGVLDAMGILPPNFLNASAKVLCRLGGVDDVFSILG